MACVNIVDIQVQRIYDRPIPKAHLLLAGPKVGVALRNVLFSRHSGLDRENVTAFAAFVRKTRRQV